MLPWVSTLPGFPAASLIRDFARTPLTRFLESGDESPDPQAPQSFDQLTARRDRISVPESTMNGRDNPQGFRTGSVPNIRARNSPGLWIRLTLRPALLPA
jgi:hypothetical protein